MVEFERVSTMLVVVNDYYHFDYEFVAAYFGYVVVAAVAAVMANVGIAAVVAVAAAVKCDDCDVVVVENDVE